MSDRAAVTLTVYAADTPQQITAVCTQLAEHGFEDTGHDDHDHFTLGYGMVASELCLGYAGDIAAALQEAGVTFEVYQDARYEFDGDGYIGVPGMPLFDYTGGGSGERMVPVMVIQRALQKPRAVRAVLEVIGDPQRDVIAQLQANLQAAAPIVRAMPGEDDLCGTCSHPYCDHDFGGECDLAGIVGPAACECKAFTFPA
jgi:hypothetical protein